MPKTAGGLEYEWQPWAGELVHWVVGKWMGGKVRYFASCGIVEPRGHWWTINPDLVSCPKCLKNGEPRAPGGF